MEGMGTGMAMDMAMDMGMEEPDRLSHPRWPSQGSISTHI
jgi:hypothetical protein